jgi:hypothetical protein
MPESDYITVIDQTGRRSSLFVKNLRADADGKMVVVGVLHHQSIIEPASIKDCDKWITWLNEWKSRKIQEGAS